MDTELCTACPDPEDLALLLTIRHVELALLDLFAAGQVSGTTHTCLGQEYIPVALTPLLAPAFVLSNHRGHGHYLARFRDPAGLLAEILGRRGAVCGGRGGSQHLYRDGFCSTGVQGESVAVALGVAMHLRHEGAAGLAVAYVGDGTWGEGVVYESLNVAQLRRLPLLIVVENNGIAQSTPTSLAMAGSVEGRARAFGCQYRRVDSTWVPDIRRQLAPDIAATRSGAGPLVVEFRTHRLGPHSKGDDRRDPGELENLRRADWYTTYRLRCPAHFDRADRVAAETVAAVVADVLGRPLADGVAG